MGTAYCLMSVENENDKPSCHVLFKLAHELGIAIYKIFSPDKPSDDKERKFKTIYRNSMRRSKSGLNPTGFMLPDLALKF